MLSPGNDGAVTQTNAAGSAALATNGNSTTQLAGQTQLGPGGTGIQTADQSASNTQLAGALSAASQYGASNVNLPIRVGSSGSGGAVTQTNAVGSLAAAANGNSTTQGSGQTQAGAGGCGCAGSSTGIQTADQSAANTQLAGSHSTATQVAPKNVNLDIRVGSSGSGGAVTQTNAVGSLAAATNGNSTTQGSGQSQTGAGSGIGIQTADQSASSTQAAGAGSSATQVAPKNVNIGVRVLSPGDNGAVTQSNVVGSAAIASNANETKQLDLQHQTGTGTCGCAGASTGVQTATQSAGSAQGAFAGSSATQLGASNVNMPIRVGSSGSDGSVSQTNAVLSTAVAANHNGTLQAAGQSQVGGGSGTGIQTIDQKALNFQGASAGSAAYQLGASNTNAPIRVGSPGGGGSVTQANIAGSAAIASNDNGTFQLGGQSQAGGRECGCNDGTGIQTLEQTSLSAQGAHANSAAVQAFPHSPCGCAAGGNTNNPIRVGSYGNDGRVTQVNAVGSLAAATNDNHTGQLGLQSQQGGSGIGIQTIDQKALNFQGASAGSAAYQLGASNTNAPIRVGSPGGGGSVTQANIAGSAAIASNDNGTFQLGGQSQVAGRGCGCADGIGIQALGQHASNFQGARADSVAVQAFPHSPCGCSAGGNSNSPIRVGSWGDDGRVTQVNAVGSLAAATNHNSTFQLGAQSQLGGAGIGIQALGQQAWNGQGAGAYSAALQAGASNENSPLRVGSPGSAGSVTQANIVGSAAIASNANWTKQIGAQFQLGSSRCGCDGIGIQALGQSALSRQLGSAGSQAIQLAPSNDNSPTSVWSSGAGGSVFQLNAAGSLAAALNRNRTHQLALQFQL